MLRDQAIYVAGHQGLLGSALLKTLASRGYENIFTRTRHELDLLNQTEVFDFLKNEKPECIFIAAGRVGGIGANTRYPANFLYENLTIQSNLIHGAFKAGIQDLVFMATSCIYPPLSKKPFTEASLLTGPLAPTHQPYAIAKIAGLELCQTYNAQYGTRYRILIPTNLYGPHDNFDHHDAHVIPALIRRLHEAKREGMSSVTLWGTGTARRQFLFSEDLADACLFLIENDAPLVPMNIGDGIDMSIAELAQLLAETVGFRGTIIFDCIHPDGMPKCSLDSHKIEMLGWHAHTSLPEGLRRTYSWFLEQEKNLLPNKRHQCQLIMSTPCP